MSKGFIGVDRSGSEADLPYVVASVFTKRKNNFNELYDQIREKCSKFNPALAHASEIKSKEIKSEKTMQDIINLCLVKEMKISVVSFDGSIRRISKGICKGHLKAESIIWSKSIGRLIECGLKPNLILIDLSFTNTEDQSLFDFLISKSIKERFQFEPIVKSSDSKYEVSIKVADLVAGFFRKSTRIRKKFKELYRPINRDRLREDLRALVHTSIRRSNNEKGKLVYKSFGRSG